MKRTWKKVLSAVLTTSMLFSLMPTFASAQECEHECTLENGCVVQECQHEHDADCYIEEELNCSHECSVESGCLMVDCLHTEHDAECGGLEDAEEPAEPTAAELLNEKINALPSAKKIAKMSEEEREALSAEMDALYAEIEAADAETLKALDLEKFEKAMAALTGEAETTAETTKAHICILRESADGLKESDYSNSIWSRFLSVDIKCKVTDAEGNEVAEVTDYATWMDLDLNKEYTLTVTDDVNGYEPSEGCTTTFKVTSYDESSHSITWAFGEGTFVNPSSAPNPEYWNYIEIKPSGAADGWREHTYNIVIDSDIQSNIIDAATPPVIEVFSPRQEIENEGLLGRVFYMASFYAGNGLSKTMNILKYDGDGTDLDDRYLYGIEPTQTEYKDYGVAVTKTGTTSTGGDVFTLRVGNSYKVAIDAGIANGTVTANKSASLSGTTVTLTVAPAENYQLKSGSLKVNDGAVTVTPVTGTENQYTFTMPAADVTVTAEFEEMAAAKHTCSGITNAEALVLEASGGTTLTSGSYYLNEDMTANETITINGDVKLCLNGHKLDSSLETGITVSSGTLTVCDCSASSHMKSETATYDGTTVATYQYQNGGGKINTKISGDVVLKSGILIGVEGDTVKIEGGSILAGNQTAVKATSSFTMSGGYVESSAVITLDVACTSEISDGVIVNTNSDYTVTSYGAVANDSGNSTTMTGGLIISNKQPAVSLYSYSGVTGGGRLNLSGGTLISSADGERAGAVMTWSTIKLMGKVNIYAPNSFWVREQIDLCGELDITSQTNHTDNVYTIGWYKSGTLSNSNREVVINSDEGSGKKRDLKYCKDKFKLSYVVGNSAADAALYLDYDSDTQWKDKGWHTLMKAHFHEFPAGTYYAKTGTIGEITTATTIYTPCKYCIEYNAATGVISEMSIAEGGLKKVVTVTPKSDPVVFRTGHEMTDFATLAYEPGYSNIAPVIKDAAGNVTTSYQHTPGSYRAYFAENAYIPFTVVQSTGTLKMSIDDIPTGGSVKVTLKQGEDVYTAFNEAPFVNGVATFTGSDTKTVTIPAGITYTTEATDVDFYSENVTEGSGTITDGGTANLSVSYVRQTTSMHFKAVEETVTASEVPGYSGANITEGAKLTLYVTEGGSTTELTTADSYTLQWGKEYTLMPTVTDTATYDATKTVGNIVFTIDKNGEMQVTSGNADQFTFDNVTKTIIVTVPRKEYKISTYATDEFSPNPSGLKLNGVEKTVVSSTPVKKGDKVAVTIAAATGCKITSVELKEAGVLTEMSYTVTKPSDYEWTVIFTMPSNNVNLSMRGVADYVGLSADVTGGTAEWKTSGSPTFDNPSQVLNKSDVIMKLTPYAGRTLKEGSMKVTYVAGAGLVKTVTLTPNSDGTWTFKMPALPTTISAIYEISATAAFKVTDANGQQVDGVTVKKGSTPLTGTSEDVYTETYTEAGTYTYTVSAVGYEDKTVTIVLTDNGESGVSVTVDGTTYSGTAIPVQLQRKTMTAEIKIVDASDNTALTDATNYTITDADNNTVTATSHQAGGLNWGETYTLTVTKAADGYKMPATAAATFTFDKTGKMKVNGTEVSGNIVQMALEKTAVKLQVLGANGNQLPGTAVKILNGTTEAATFTSGNSVKTVEKLVTGTTYTIRVASVPEGKATPADVTVKLNADGTIAADGTTAVYSGDTITLKIWNSIPVDANGNGTVEGSEDNATVGEPDNGIYKDAEGSSPKTYLPVDVNGDGNTDHYVPRDVLHDNDNDGIWTNDDEDAFYIPSGYDDGGKPTGFIKVVDSDNDGIYGKDNGTGGEKEDSDKYIPDKDGDGKPEPDTNGDGIFEGTKDENGDGKPDNKYIPVDKDNDGKKEDVLVDSNGDGIFGKDTDGDGKEDSDGTKYIPDQDGDDKPEPDTDNDGIFEGSGSNNNYIPDPDDTDKTYVDTDGDGIYGDKDGDGNEKDGESDNKYVPVDKNTDGKMDDAEKVIPQPDGTYKGEESGIEYLPDQDGDNLPEPDTDGDGIFEGTKGEDTFIPDKDGDGVPEVDSNSDGVFGKTDSSGKESEDGNRYIPVVDENDPEKEPSAADKKKDDAVVDDNKDGIYDQKDASGNEKRDDDTYYIPVDKDDDGTIDGVKEVTKRNDNVYVDPDGTEYIPDQDGDGLPEPDTNGDGVFEGTKDGEKYNEDGSKWYPSSDNKNNPTAKRYNIVINATQNGTVKSSNRTVKSGTTVTLTATPDQNFALRSITVVDRENRQIALTDNGDGTYSFKMPRSSVTVTAKFSGNTATNPEEIDPNNAMILTINDRLVWVFGEPVMNDVAPIIRNERTVLPIRFITETFGGTVTWDETQKKVTILKEETQIELFIGQTYATVNGERIALDAPAFIENGRTYLPLRFVAENLNMTVLWKADTQQVYIIPNETLNLE